MTSLLLKFWKEIAIAILVGYLVTSIYGSWKNDIIQDTNQKWEESFAKMQEDQKEQLKVIERLATTAVEQTLINKEVLSNDITKIRQDIRNNPLTITLPNQECRPSPEFVQIYNQIKSRGNK